MRLRSTTLSAIKWYIATEVWANCERFNILKAATKVTTAVTTIQHRTQTQPCHNIPSIQKRSLDQGMALSYHCSLDADLIASIIFDVKGPQDVSSCGLTSSECTMDTSVSDHGAMLSRELKTRILVLLQRLHKELGLISHLVCGIGTESSQGTVSVLAFSATDLVRKCLTLASTSLSPHSRVAATLCMVQCEANGTGARRTCRSPFCRSWPRCAV